jgi:hypothetical protein
MGDLDRNGRAALHGRIEKAARDAVRV